MLIIEPCAGLGNRFIALASAYYAAKANGHELAVIWKEESCLGAPMKKLITLPEWIKVIEIREQGWKADCIGQFRGNLIKKKYRGMAERFFEPDEIMDLYNKEGAKGIDSLLNTHSIVYVKATNPFYDIYDKEDTFAFIKPCDEIGKRVESVMNSLTEGEAGSMHRIGVHIRRTDHIEAIQNSPMELFVEQMKSELELYPDTIFYVASDDPATQDELKEIFPGKVLTYQGKALDRNSVEGIQDAYTEMLCLSSCEKIYGSFHSTFSLLASQLGGIPLEVLTKK